MTLTPEQITAGWKPVPDDLDTIPAMAWIEPMFRGPEDRAKGVRRTHGPAYLFDWTQDGGDDDIVAYRSTET